MRQSIRQVFPNKMAWAAFLISDFCILVAAIIFSASIVPSGIDPEIIKNFSEVANLQKMVAEEQRVLAVATNDYLGTVIERQDRVSRNIAAQSASNRDIIASMSVDTWTVENMNSFLSYLRANHPELFNEIPNANFFKNQYLKINQASQSEE